MRLAAKGRVALSGAATARCGGDRTGGLMDARYTTLLARPTAKWPSRLIGGLFLLLIAALAARLGATSWTVPSVSAAGVSLGQRLFDHETFGGNGRTCRTCHSGDDGTIDPEEVASRLALNPLDPLFVHDGLDDFVSGTSRIAEHAAILIERELPEGVVLLDDPSATSVVFARGVPSTVNTPALDPELMYDMRHANLLDQAAGAIDRHAQPSLAPTAEQLQVIAEFQQTDNRFFSSKVLKSFAEGGAPPRLPEGHTASEKRGREFFVDA